MEDGILQVKADCCKGRRMTASEGGILQLGHKVWRIDITFVAGQHENERLTGLDWPAGCEIENLQFWPTGGGFKVKSIYWPASCEIQSPQLVGRPAGK